MNFIITLYFHLFLFFVHILYYIFDFIYFILFFIFIISNIILNICTSILYNLFKFKIKNRNNKNIIKKSDQRIIFNIDYGTIIIIIKKLSGNISLKL